MKKILVVLLCVFVLCGCGDKGKRFSKEDGDRIEYSLFYVERVTKDGDAIAGWRDGNRRGRVLFLYEKDFPYYDGQTISIPDGEYLVTIGTYTFEEADEDVLLDFGKVIKTSRTIPIVARRQY